MHMFEAELAKRRGLEYFELHSAGLIARTGQPGEPELNRELKRLGYPPLKHTATELELGMVDAADLILTAEEDQRSQIVRSLPLAATKTLTLKQMARIAEAIAEGSSAIPALKTQAGSSLDLLRARLQHLITYRGYAPNPDFEVLEDIDDPYQTGKHREAAREVQESIESIIRWWLA